MRSAKSKASKDVKVDNQLDTENIITYELSDHKFIEMGWTVLSDDKEKQKLVTYQAEPAKNYYVWFKERTQEEKKYYKNGKLFVIFKTDGTGRVLYPDGQLAIKVSKHETGARMIVLNPSGKDDTGFYRQKSLAAMFDSFGNGIIYDTAGKVRLKYSQKEGILLDTQNGLPVHWHWKVSAEIQKMVTSKECMNQCHKIPAEVVEQARCIFEMRERERGRKSGRESTRATKEMPVSQTKSIKNVSSNVSHKKSSIAKSLAIEQSFSTTDDVKTPPEKPTSLHLKKTREFVSQNRQENTIKTFMFAPEKCTPIKIIVLKINKAIGFRILDQSNVSLEFNAGKKALRLELGVRVNPHIEVCINEVSKDTISVKDVPCIFELLPTASMMCSRNLCHRQRQNVKKVEIKRDVPVPSKLS